MNPKPQRITTLRELREQAGYSQEGLGRIVGCSFRSISEWESGRQTPRFDNAVELAKALKVSLKTVATAMGIDVSGVPDEADEKI